MVEQPSEDKEGVQEIFRLTTEEHAKLPGLIEVAFRQGHISKPTKQEYMLFAMNCAVTVMKQTAKERRGIG